jgi:hypothetical protein
MGVCAWTTGYRQRQGISTGAGQHPKRCPQGSATGQHFARAARPHQRVKRDSGTHTRLSPGLLGVGQSGPTPGQGRGSEVGAWVRVVVLAHRELLAIAIGDSIPRGTHGREENHATSRSNNKPRARRPYPQRNANAAQIMTARRGTGAQAPQPPAAAREGAGCGRPPGPAPRALWGPRPRCVARSRPRLGRGPGTRRAQFHMNRLSRRPARPPDDHPQDDRWWPHLSVLGGLLGVAARSPG